MEYNRLRYLELLKHSQNLENQGKSLAKENREDFLEFLGYRVRLEDHIFWQKRHQFFSVMENFINGTIDSDEFFGMAYKNRKAHEAFQTDLEKLEDFQPDLRSKGFSKFIGGLLSDCEVFEPDSTLRESDDYTEEQLKDSVRDAILQIQKYL